MSGEAPLESTAYGSTSTATPPDITAPRLAQWPLKRSGAARTKMMTESSGYGVSIVAMHEDPIPALKRQMAETIAAITQNWSLGDAAAVMTTDRWRVADIRAGRLQRFSLETLIRFANNLGYDTAIQTERRKLRVASKTERATGSPQR